MPPEVAAAYAGVVRSTFNDWLSKGRAAITSANGNLPTVLAKNEYAQFAVEVEEALARFVVGNMATITDAGTRRHEGEWQALGWQLERRFPQWFGRKTRTEHTGPGGGPIRHQHAVVTIAIPEQAWELLSVNDRIALAEILGKVEGHVHEHQDEAPLLGLNA